MTYEHELYASPIRLPARRIGNMEVTHRWLEKGDSVVVVGFRQALLRHIAPVRAILEERRKVHALVEHHPPTGKGKLGGTSLWMTDLPEELNQIGELLYTVRPRGRILVGGLGLGILATALVNWPGVHEIVVVEQSSDVIKLCKRPRLFTTECADIATFLNTTDQTFDYYLLDTWAETNEGAWWDTVMPLRRTIRNRHGVKPVIHCWAEDMMIAQVHRSLTNPCAQPHWYYSKMPVPMSDRDARYFLRSVGTHSWEAKFGAAVDGGIRSVNGPKRRHAYEGTH